jgi:hypothetical protein
MTAIDAAYRWDARLAQRPVLVDRGGFARILGGITASLTLALGVLLTAAPPVAAATYIAPLDVPFFSQNNTGSPWYSDQLGTCGGSTIHSAGCAVTSMAMLEAYHGLSVSSTKGTGMDPGILNGWMTANGGYSGGCDVFWSKVPSDLVNTSIINFAAVGRAGLSASTRSKIESELSAGRPVIAYLPNPHFVVITGETPGGDFYINDPGDVNKPANPPTLFTRYQLAGIRTYSPSRTTITVDETSSRFVKAGPAKYWTATAAAGYGRSMLYTGRSSAADVNSATWTPTLPNSGYWEVYAWIPSSYAGTIDARYRIKHNSVTTLVSVNQAAYASVWVSLGVYVMNAGSANNVYLGDGTSDRSSQLVGFDAIRWVWHGAPTPI